MPAVGLALPVLLVVQVAFARFAFVELAPVDRGAAWLAALLVFATPLVLAFRYGTVFDLVVGELLALSVYLLARRASVRRPTAD